MIRLRAPRFGARPYEPTNKWLVTLSITFGTLMGAIDTSIVNVALPHIRGAVGATLQEITWIGTGYAMALVLVMPLTAFLGRMFGQKRVYMACLALFVVGSALCGVANSLATLTIFRVIQGLGAGALQPTEQAILRQTFPAKEQGMAMAVFSMAIMIGPALGPSMGGFIVDHFHWSWIFFINLPIGLLGFFMVGRFVHEDPEILEQNHSLAEEQRRNIDWAGIGLMWTGLGAVEFVLEEGSRRDWFHSPLISVMAVVGVFALIAFVIRELTARVPAVDLRLFKEPVFLMGTLVSAVMFTMLIANMFLLPVFMQELLGFSALQSGLAMMPRTLIMMVAVPIVGRTYNIVPPRIYVVAGALLIALSAWMLSHLTIGVGTSDIVAALLVQGLGFAILFVPMSTISLSRIPRHKMADATGLSSLIRQIGGAIGLAIVGTLISNYATQARAGLDAHIVATRPEVWQRVQATQGALMARGMDVLTAKTFALRSIMGSLLQQSMVLSFNRIYVVLGIMFLLVLPMLFFVPVGPQDHVDADVHLEI